MTSCSRVRRRVRIPPSPFQPIKAQRFAGDLAFCPTSCPTTSLPQENACGLSGVRAISDSLGGFRDCVAGQTRSALTGSADVTLNVRPNNTLIHLTMGGPRNSAPTVTTSKPAQRSGAKNRGLYVVPKKPPLAPGHSTCRYPSVPSLPPGWHWCRFERRVVTDVGVKVPIVDDPTVGTDAQRAALRVFREWEAVKAERKVAA
jgi:hypothetical protein